MNRHRQLALITALLLLAAGLRLWHLGTIPPGFSNAEFDTLNVTDQLRLGRIVVFAHVPGYARIATPGQETLFSLIQSIAAQTQGDGLITLRLLSLWSGLITLALLYALARRLYNRRIALIAVALMAVGFWPVLLARLSLREAAVPLFTTATLLALVNAFHIRRDISPHPPTIAGFTALGAITGISLYAHWFGVFLAVIVTLSVAYLFLTRQRISRRAAGASAFAILISAIIVIPYAVTTLRMPELSGLAALRDALMPTSLPESILRGVMALFVQGDSSPVFNLPGRPLLDPITALLFVTGLALSLRRWRRPADFIPTIAVATALIPALLSTRPGSHLAFVGALPLFYLLAACAVLTLPDLLARVFPRASLRRALPWLMVALIAANAIWTGIDLFAAWPARDDVQESYHASRGLLAHYLDRTAGRLPTVVCSPQLLDTAAQPGDPTMLALMMHRRNATLRFVDCANGLVIAEGGAQQQVVFTDPAMYGRMHPTLRGWLQGRPLITIPGLPPYSAFELDIAPLVENTVGRLLTTAPTGWAPESPGGPGPVTLPVRFGGNLTFLGYTRNGGEVYTPGEAVPIITYWRVDGPVPADVHIFAHVLSDPAAIVAQTHAINVLTPSLQNRDIFIQVNYVVLPESVPPGSYDISIGAFQVDSGLRLPVFDGERVRGDRLFLYQITVTGAN